MIIGTGVNLIIAIIFIEDQPGIDISNVTGDIDFLGKDEDLWEIVHGIVGFVRNIDVAIDGEGTIYEHSEGIHKLLTSGIASRDEITSMIELIEIGGTIHGAKTGVSLVIELGEAEIVFRGGLV